MKLLKLIALDEDDLNVLSAQLQDAIIRAEDMAFIPQEERFAVLANRFDWLSADEKREANGGGYERRRCALRFEKVRQAQFKNLLLQTRKETLELLAIEFEPSEAPSGFIQLIFSGGGAVRLSVDCIEAELRDLGPIWKTPRKPNHPEDGPQDKATS